MVVQMLWLSRRLTGWSGGGLIPETYECNNLPLTMERLCLGIILEFIVVDVREAYN